MITQGTSVTGRCDACGGETDCDVGQFVEGGMLHWGTEGRCRSCPNGWCEEDSGPVTPDGIRDALLSAHGPARLRTTGRAGGSAPVMKALRSARPMSLAEARATAARLFGTGLAGTLVETEFLADLLRRAGVDVVVEFPARRP
ncbi:MULTISPECIES: hypothetical protein [unclassified Streptomyces]|uniref:hypothetical protein n=1 Tax=unclassified Streptomyces TaxID=2593676 RepID=UPI0033AC6A9A